MINYLYAMERIRITLCPPNTGENPQTLPAPPPVLFQTEESGATRIVTLAPISTRLLADRGHKIFNVLKHYNYMFVTMGVASGRPPI